MFATSAKETFSIGLLMISLPDCKFRFKKYPDKKYRIIFNNCRSRLAEPGACIAPGQNRRGTCDTDNNIELRHRAHGDSEQTSFGYLMFRHFKASETLQIFSFYNSIQLLSGRMFRFHFFQFQITQKSRP